MPKIILFNGPPGVGKDTLAWALHDHINGAPGKQWCVHEKFSLPIKLAFCVTLGVTYDFDEHRAPNEYENNKEALIPLLGVSYRRWQIDFSEKFMKPLYGKDIFGRLLIERIVENPSYDYVVISDCGFQIEIETLYSHFPSSDITLITLEREGKTFAGDSRETVKAYDGGLELHYFNPECTKEEAEHKFLHWCQVNGVIA